MGLMVNLICYYANQFINETSIDLIKQQDGGISIMGLDSYVFRVTSLRDWRTEFTHWMKSKRWACQLIWLNIRMSLFSAN